MPHVIRPTVGAPAALMLGVLTTSAAADWPTDAASPLHVGPAESLVEIRHEVAADGASLYLVDDSLDVARHAAEHGWIRREAVEAVAAALESADPPRDAVDDLIEAAQEKGEPHD